MMEAAMNQFFANPAETRMQDELLQGDRLIASAEQILRHLLTDDDHSMFSDAVVARIRGMLAGVERQLLAAQAQAGGIADPRGFISENAGPLHDALMDSSLFIGHAHSLALEWQLSERLELRYGLDCVLSPLLQEMIASDDAEVSGMAMSFLAAQARFVQQQRRMELPLAELPGDLFHTALLTWRSAAPGGDGENAAAAERGLRATFDEGRSRLGLMTRLVMTLGGRAGSTLNVPHAGVALFLSALALSTGEDRRVATLATNDRQAARLALMLRSAGLGAALVEQQFAFLHPEIALPDGFDALSADRAAALLSASALGTGGE